MSSDLKAKTVKGFSWSFAGQIVNQVLAFAISIVLARLLGPEAFGLIGMVMGITAILSVIQDFGLGSAIIQKNEIEKNEFSSIFIFNTIVGVILFVALFLSSGLFADFFNETKLEFLFQLSAIGLIFGSMSSSLGSLISKELDFKKLTYIHVVVNLLAGGLGLYLAYTGFGVMSLVIRNLFSSGLTTIVLWIFSPIKPGLYFNFHKIRSFLSFGANLLGINVVARTFEQVDILIIGRFYNPASVGFYNRAKSMKVLPLLTITSVLNKVLFPVYSQIKNDEKRITKYFSFSVGVLSLVYVPIMGLMVFYSEELIILLLTEKWQETIPYLQLLCITGFFMPISSVSNNILISRGKANFSLKYILVKRIIYSIVLLGAAPFGVFYFVLVNALYAGITGLTDLYFACREINLKFSIPVKKIFLQIVNTSVAVAVTYSVLFFVSRNFYTNIIIGLPLFSGLYISLNYMSKNTDWNNTIEFVNPYIFNFKNRLKLLFIK